MADSQGSSSKIELRVLRSHHTASVRQKVAKENIPEAMGHMFQLVRSALDAQSVQSDGAPFARYHSFGDTVDLEAGSMVASPIVADGDVTPGHLPAGPAAISVHVGPYETLGQTYDALQRWLSASGSHAAAGGPWELYITDPSAEPDSSKWLTEVIFPLKPA
jgi:effector-binding domain-containing protein